MDTKGFFINSSYQRTRLLKALFHSLGRKEKDREEEKKDSDYTHPPFRPGDKNQWITARRGR